MGRTDNKQITWTGGDGSRLGNPRRVKQGREVGSVGQGLTRWGPSPRAWCPWAKALSAQQVLDEDFSWWGRLGEGLLPPLMWFSQEAWTPHKHIVGVKKS